MSCPPLHGAVRAEPASGSRDVDQQNSQANGMSFAARLDIEFRKRLEESSKRDRRKRKHLVDPILSPERQSNQWDKHSKGREEVIRISSQPDLQNLEEFGMSPLTDQPRRGMRSGLWNDQRESRLPPTPSNSFEERLETSLEMPNSSHKTVPDNLHSKLMRTKESENEVRRYSAAQPCTHVKPRRSRQLPTITRPPNGTGTTGNDIGRYRSTYKSPRTGIAIDPITPTPAPKKEPDEVERLKGRRTEHAPLLGLHSEEKEHMRELEKSTDSLNAGSIPQKRDEYIDAFEKMSLGGSNTERSTHSSKKCFDDENFGLAKEVHTPVTRPSMSPTMEAVHSVDGDKYNTIGSLPALVMSTHGSETPESKHLQVASLDIKYTAKLDMLHGPLRTTSDGGLIDEDTGEWLKLDTFAENTTHKHAAIVTDGPNSPWIAMPEAKNGATGLDPPRARKSIHRVFRNWLTGSSKPPAEEVRQLFILGTKPPSFENLKEMVRLRRHIRDKETCSRVLDVLKKFWGEALDDMHGRIWFERAKSDDGAMRELEDWVLGVMQHSESLL